MKDALTRLADLVGHDAMGEILEQFGGQSIYLPHRLPLHRDEVASEFDTIVSAAPSVGVAYELVATKHGVSRRTVERIIARKIDDIRE